MFEKVTGRMLTDQEQSTLMTYLEAQKKAYEGKTPEIEKFLTAGMHKVNYKTAELAAYTAVARVILNLHESITVY